MVENYIVRIYQRDETDPNKIAGVFESVEQQTEKTFSTLKSLMSLLTPAQDSPGNAAEQTATRKSRTAILSD